MQRITLMAAVANNRCIGINNTLPWHLPEDFAFFKQYTLHKPVIMGRKTWEGLPRKPLPQRRNLVISHQEDYIADGAEVYMGLSIALQKCVAESEVVIIGGAQIYQQALSIASDLRLTEIACNVQGDAFFPEFSMTIWQEVERIANTSKEGIHFDFVHYVRR